MQQKILTEEIVPSIKIKLCNNGYSVLKQGGGLSQLGGVRITIASIEEGETAPSIKESLELVTGDGVAEVTLRDHSVDPPKDLFTYDIPRTQHWQRSRESKPPERWGTENKRGWFSEETRVGSGLIKIHRQNYENGVIHRVIKLKIGEYKHPKVCSHSIDLGVDQRWQHPAGNLVVRDPECRKVHDEELGEIAWCEIQIDHP